MQQNLKTKEKYVLGYNEKLNNFFSSRRAETHAKHLLSHLQQGMHVLDVGCGPGSITVDLAKIVNPGKVIGIDIDDRSIESAKQLALRQNVENVSFQKGNIYDIPFDDESFDAVNAHAVLCQIKDSAAGITELKRDVKRGGIVASREPNFDLYIIYPDEPVFLRAMNLARQAVAECGCDFNIGKKMKSFFHQAGFSEISIAASCEDQPTAEHVRYLCESLIEDWETAPWSQVVRELNWATESEIEEFKKAIIKFGQNPGAFLSTTWCAATGRR